MDTYQQASDSLHPPVVHAGVPTGGESWGLFDGMKSPAQYESEIDDLKAMNERLKEQLAKALQSVANGYKTQL